MNAQKLFVLVGFAATTHSCTNILVSKGASADNSTQLSYNADSGSLYGSLGSALPQSGVGEEKMKTNLGKSSVLTQACNYKAKSSDKQSRAQSICAKPDLRSGSAPARGSSATASTARCRCASWTTPGRGAWPTGLRRSSTATSRRRTSSAEICHRDMALHV